MATEEVPKEPSEAGPPVKKSKSRLKRYLYFAGSSLAFLLVFTAISAVYTSRSEFCTSCHYMQPFYDSWKMSSHKSVECIECHFAPGLKNKVRGKMEGLVQLVKYATNAYQKSKPWAEIPDESCLRSGCHNEQLLEGRGEEKFGNVTFVHKPHLTEMRKGKKLRCTSCHSQIVQGDHMTVTESTCFICHFKADDGDHSYKDISGCQICHKWERVTEEEMKLYRYDHTSVVQENLNCSQCHDNVISGRGSVPKENCFSCHWEQERLKKIGDTELLHNVHISEHKIECLQCHLPIEHQKPSNVQEMVSNCESCHTGKHQSQGILFSGSGGRLKQAIPNMMFEEGISCKGCHVFHGFDANLAKLETTSKASGKSCEGCHGKGYDRLLKQWNNFTDKSLNLVNRSFKIAQQRQKTVKLNASDHKKVEELMLDAGFNLDLVETGKAIHNIKYASALLEKANEDINESLKLMGSPPNASASQLFAGEKLIPNDCANCHIGIEETILDVYGHKFSHGTHLVQNKLSCKQCHSNVRKHGQLVMTKETCLSCHHSVESQKKCKDCHVPQFQMYSGNVNVFDKPEPDIMFAEEVTCEDCHRQAQTKMTRHTAPQCEFCHDIEYRTTLKEWQDETKKSIAEIRELLKAKNIGLDQKRINMIHLKLSVIEKDGSLGVHNKFTIEEVLADIESELKTNLP